MNIAEICFSPGWGGLEHYVVDTSRRLLERDHDVLSIVSPNSALENSLTSIGLNPVSRNSQNYFDPLTTLYLSRQFKVHNTDAIHLHRTQDLGTVLPAANLANVPVRVLTLQMESERRKKDLYHRWIYRNLTNVLTITERMRRLMIDNVACESKKIICNYYGIERNEIREGSEPKKVIRDRWNIDNNAFVIGIVGRLEPYKGQHILLEAINLIEDEFENLVLLIVGDETVGSSGYKEQILEQVKRLSRTNVIFTGYQHPPGSIVPGFDVSILASEKETFGLVVIEAMTLGIPVIGTDAGGVPEIIEDGINGLLVPPLDAGMTAQAILKLYRDDNLRSRLAVAAETTCDEKFGMGRHIQCLERTLAGSLKIE